MSREAASNALRLVCFGVHAERLHRDEVWEVVDAATSQLEQAGCRLTFFVNPLGSRGTGRLAPRLAALADRGHEIGQHTHYYTSWEETPDAIRKESSRDPGVFLRCLDRDRALLGEAGIGPAGFVSGA